MSELSKLSVDDLIRLYAEATARDLSDTSSETTERRVDLHDALCAALKIDRDRDDFKPFEAAELTTIPFTVKMCETMIRREIEKLKARTESA